MTHSKLSHLRARGFARLPTLGLLCACAGGILFGMGGFTFHYAEGLSYLSNDPQACVNCHIMRDQYDGWLKSTHHDAATCNDCHVPVDFLGKYFTKVEHGIRHSKGFTFQDFHEPIQIKPSSRAVVQANCVRCHMSLVQDLNVHTRDADCAHCHSGIGHGARP